MISEACTAGHHGACGDDWLAWALSTPATDYPCRCECHTTHDVDELRALLAGSTPRSLVPR